jgi:hypothetical protein
MADTPNPFDDNSVKQVNAFDSGAYGDAYEVNTAPPSHNNALDDGAYGSSQPEPPQQFGDPNEYDTSNMHTMEMDTRSQPVPDDQLHRTCKGYSPGMLWVWSGACAALLAFAGLFDMLFGSLPNFLQCVVDIYLIAVGLSLLFVEIPNNCCNDKSQMRAYRWARMLRRAWGKAFIYSFFAFLCCTDSASVKTGCGVCVILLSLGIWFIGWQTARILKDITNKIVSGAELGSEDFDIILERKFRQLNNNSEKKVLTSQHIFNLGKECGYWLNSTEVWLLTKYWDDNADGEISLEEWLYGIRQSMTGRQWLKML